MSIDLKRTSGLAFFEALCKAGWVSEDIRYHIELKPFTKFLWPTKCYLTSDRKTGYAILPDGELIALFNLGPPLRGYEALQHAMSKGPKTMICFKGIRSYYALKMGWTLVCEEDNWKGEDHPKVCYFRLDENTITNACEIRSSSLNLGGQ